MPDAPEARIAQLRRELGLPEDVIAVNAGTWGPLCQRAQEATVAFTAEARTGRIDADAFAVHALSVLRSDRETVAAFLGCAPEEIALCESTTVGLNIALWGIDFQPGDEIVYGSLENPAGRIPLWVLAERRQLKLRRAELSLGEADTVEALRAQITPRTRAIFISDVNFATGTRVDLAAVSRLAREHGALVLVDGVQAMGTVPIDVRASGVDAYAVARHKFICGPDGAGALYLRKGAMSSLSPTFAGVCSDKSYGKAGTFELAPTAERFEVSTRCFEAFAGGTAALRWFDRDVGADFAYRRVAALRAKLWDRLSEIRGLRLLSGRTTGTSLLSFHVEGLPCAEVVRQLGLKKIHSRTITATSPEAVRLSLGFWNRESDLDVIVDALAVAARR